MCPNFHSNLTQTWAVAMYGLHLIAAPSTVE